MISFFKGIFKPDTTVALGPNEHRLYFNLNKELSMVVNILPEHTTQDTYNVNHNIMIDYILNCHSMQAINSSEFNFVIINDNLPNTWIKLKSNDKIKKFLKNSSFNLYYLNCTNLKQQIKDNIELSAMNENKKLANPNKETIREGELLKYSFSNHKFEKRYIMLDKDKLVLRKNKENELYVIQFSDVVFITTEINEKNVIQQATSKYIFEIRTKDSERYFFSSKNKNDLDAWIDSISYIFSVNKDNDKIKDLSNQVKRSANDIYSKEVKLTNCLFNITGTFAIPEIRKAFLNYSEVYQAEQSVLLFEEKEKEYAKRRSTSYPDNMNNMNDSSRKESTEKEQNASIRKTSYENTDLGIDILHNISTNTLNTEDKDMIKQLSNDKDQSQLKLSIIEDNDKEGKIKEGSSTSRDIKRNPKTEPGNKRNTIQLDNKKPIYNFIKILQRYKLKTSSVRMKKLTEKVNESKTQIMSNELLSLFDAIFQELEYTKIHKTYMEYLNIKSKASENSERSDITEQKDSLDRHTTSISYKIIKTKKDRLGMELSEKKNSKSSLPKFSETTSSFRVAKKHNSGNVGSSIDSKALQYEDNQNNNEIVELGEDESNYDNTDDNLGYTQSKRTPIKLSNSHYKQISNTFSLIESYRSSSKPQKIINILKHDLFDELYYKALVLYFNAIYQQFLKDIIELYNNVSTTKNNKPMSTKISYNPLPIKNIKKVKDFHSELKNTVDRLLVSYYKAKIPQNKWFLGLDSLYGLNKQNLQFN